MALVRYNPGIESFAPTTFRNLFDRFFDNRFDNEGSESFVPSVDIAETEKSFEIHFSLPGIKKNDISIDVEDRKLTVSGERNIEKKDEGKNFRSLETSYGKFTRSFYLPEEVDASKISASYTDGILNVNIPKDTKKVLKSRIEVK